MSLEQDLQDAIRKSLPEQTAAELKTYLEEAKRNKAELAQCKTSLELSLKAQMDQTKIIATAGNLEARENLVRGKEVELAAREVSLKHAEDIMAIRINNAALRYSDAMEMMKIVFKSQPVGYAFTRAISENGQEPQGNGSCGTVYVNNNLTESTTKREITEQATIESP